MPKTAPYGSWKSPITAEMASVAPVPFVGLAVDGRALYWLECRPQEGGRYVIMRQDSDGKISACTPQGFNVRSTVHEYGGGAFAVSRGTIYFVNFQDQRLYVQLPGGSPPHALTPEGKFRYADMILDHARQRLMCVREDHTRPGEAVNTLVAVDLSGGEATILASGNDFYSNPRLSPDGTRLAYLTWNHPNMPWDGCELRVASVESDGTLGASQLIAGGPTETVFQPAWSPDGILHFVAETTGWWNLYRFSGGNVQALCPMEAEFGRPMWLFGYATYGFVSADKILCCYTQHGLDHLAWLDASSGRLTSIESEYTEVDFLRCGQGMAAFIGGAPAQPSTVVQYEYESGKMRPVHAAFELQVDRGYLSAPQSLDFPTTGGQQSHALYYPPANRDFVAPSDERPPLIVMSHGGPTSAAKLALRFEIQYWTSRGFAVADVDYGGSVGYGREYRRRLNGQWGVVDVDDCCNVALFLAEKDLADRHRLAITGGSAGGFTTFACLAFRNDVFTAGAAYYGVADLEIFVKETHKFESRYLTTLVGPYPERRDLYVARSPVHFIDNVKCALILFQGDEDKIVLPNQSQMIFDAVRANGLPTAYLLFHGEQHGFRRAENLKRSFEAELYFYSRIFNFDLPEAIEPVAIENLPA